MTRLKVSSFAYCSGVEFPEDLLIHRFLPKGYLLGVGDGVDAFHSPKVPRQLVNGESRAQVQGRAVLSCFHAAHPNDSLDKTLHQSIAALANNAHGWGVPLDRPDDLPGIDLAVAKIDGATVDLYQMGGDALAFWQLKSREIGVTLNQCADFEERKGPTFREYQRQFGTGEAWNLIEPIFREARMDLTNTSTPGAYGTMNGQSEVANLWVHITLPTEELRLLLLLTDGLYDEQESKQDTLALGIKLIKLYQQGGWDAIYAARGEFSSGEGTGIAVELA